MMMNAITQIDWVARASRSLVSAPRRNERPESVRGTMATSSLFPLFGVAPILGRTLLPSDEQSGHSHVVVLSSELWTRRFASDRDIIGREISLP